MSTNIYNEPDAFVVVKLTLRREGNPSPQAHYRVLACWIGAGFNDDRWRLNSGITKVDTEPDFYLIRGTTGSTYRCKRDRYGMHVVTQMVFDRIAKLPEVENAEILPDYDWSAFSFNTE